MTSSCRSSSTSSIAAGSTARRSASRSPRPRRWRASRRQTQANRFIQALKELGCKFALDDFGTGLSSFGYLKHFPVDYLKIDGSFVREILRDPIDREMVRSINEIGHLTGKQTIAEFAENAEIIQMLTSLGVDYAQGYGVAQPQRVLKSAVA